MGFTHGASHRGLQPSIYQNLHFQKYKQNILVLSSPFSNVQYLGFYHPVKMTPMSLKMSLMSLEMSQ